MLSTILNYLTVPGLADMLQNYLLAITSVVTAASALVALTPTKKDDRIRSLILSVLNVLALNIGNAARRNKLND